jgi:hypothetical protein
MQKKCLGFRVELATNRAPSMASSLLCHMHIADVSGKTVISPALRLLSAPGTVYLSAITYAVTFSVKNTCSGVRYIVLDVCPSSIFGVVAD